MVGTVIDRGGDVAADTVASGEVDSRSRVAADGAT